MTKRGASLLFVAGLLAAVVPTLPASATPVCTDGYKGGPPRAQCGGRVFPEPELSQGYVQFQADPRGFREFEHGIKYLAKLYPRWISVFNLADHFDDKRAVSAGPDRVRSYEKGDSKDGHDIWVIKITDHKVPDRGKLALTFSLAVHGNERGGLEGGLRTAEDLALAAENGGTIADGVDNYESTTGRKPKFHEYEVKDVLRKEVVYLVDFNPDGWAVGDYWNRPAPRLYSRGNAMGTDLNRQMPTVGRINPARNPLQESEMRYGLKWMREVKRQSAGGWMAHGADVHGELTSNAYVDIMYPAGQFDSIDHRRLMAIAERVKSVVDETLYAGIINLIEEATGGNDAEQPGEIPTKPAHWATVWDTLGYTDTGFIGDYMATDLAVTGMDYEIFLNHTVPDKVWNVYLQKNHIDGTRAMIKVAMAYALFQKQEFNARNVEIDIKGRAGYIFNPDTVTHNDENGPGTLPGPQADGVGADGKPVEQRPYVATNMQWFEDTSALLSEPFVKVLPADVARSSSHLDRLDTLVLADVALPKDVKGRSVDAKDYFANIKSWVKRGGNLVLTDRALHALVALGLVDEGAVEDRKVYQPYTNIKDFNHPMVQGLRPNARQLVEAAILGYCIGSGCSPMTVVKGDAWDQAGGAVVGTTGNASGSSDGSDVSLGELKVGDGVVRIVGGALPTPTEENDHRYGLRDYAMTYTGVFVMENSIRHDGAGVGSGKVTRERLVF